MVASAWLQWVLTASFCLTGVAHAGWLVQDRSVTRRLGDLVHLAMSFAMIAMVWPWGVGLLTWPQATVFGAAAMWFVLRTFVDRAGVPPSGAGHRVHLAFHAAMAAAMVWMLLAMPSTGGSHVAHDHAAHDHGGAPTWSALIGVALLVALVGGAVVLVADRWALGRPAWVRSTRETVASAVMSLGMIAMIVPMIQA